ncbi:MAG: MarC family protein [Betaproteobacteria bacterium]
MAEIWGGCSLGENPDIVVFRSFFGDCLDDLAFLVLAVSSIIAVVEPFSTIAVYATLTKNMSVEKKIRAITKSMTLSFVVLAFFAITGHLVFQVFNITVSAFQIAGGIMLVIVALQMLYPERDASLKDGSADIAVVPLTFPLTAGPGTITKVFLLTSRSESMIDTLFVFVGIFVGVFVSFIGLRYSSRLFKYLGDEGLRVVTAIMAIVVLAIAVQFLIDGIGTAVPQV